MLRRPAAIALSLVAAMAAIHCGEVLDPVGPTTSPPPDAAAALAEGAAPPPPPGSPDVRTNPCLWDAPFEAITRLGTTVNTTDLEADPRLSDDELTLYFTRGINTTFTHVYVATRRSLTEAFGAATEVTELNDPANPGGSTTNASPSGDELAIVFSRGTNPNWDLFMMSRQSRVGSWTDAMPLTLLNEAGTSEINAYVMPDKRTLYFASNRSANVYQIFRGTIGLDAGATVVPIPGIDGSTMGALEPVLSDDELTMWFGKRNPLQEDIWVTHRATKDAPWGDPTELTFLTTGDRDMPGFISKDLCRLYFTRGPFTSVDLDIYVATRTPK